MDLIDERNRKEKMSKSIIKRQNVVLIPPEEAKGKDETIAILENLEKQKRIEAEKKQKEIERLLQEQKKNQIEIERIMQEKQTNLQNTMDKASRGD